MSPKVQVYIHYLDARRTDGGGYVVVNASLKTRSGEFSSGSEKSFFTLGAMGEATKQAVDAAVAAIARKLDEAKAEKVSA